MSGTGENVKLVLLEYFRCSEFNTTLKRESCGRMYRTGMSKATNSQQAQKVGDCWRCRHCPIGKAHDAGMRAIDAPAVPAPVPATEAARPKPRLCICGEPLQLGRRFCSLACGSSKDRPEPEDSWAASTITAPMSAGARERW